MDKCVKCNRNLARKGFMCDECTKAQDELTIKINERVAKKLKEAADKLDKFFNHTPSPKRVD